MKRSIPRAAAAVVFALSLAGCAATGQYFDDAWITTKVKADIFALGFGTATDVNVETNAGVVQLAGFASNQAEIDAAVAAARKVPGVRSVSNRMQIKASAR
jgi:osmotically-inducible protein OsmY